MYLYTTYKLANSHIRKLAHSPSLLTILPMSRSFFRFVVSLLLFVIFVGVLYIFRNEIIDTLVELQEKEKESQTNAEIIIPAVDQTTPQDPPPTEESDTEDVLTTLDEPTSTESEQVSALLESQEKEEATFQLQLKEAKDLLDHNYFSQAAFELSYLIRQNPNDIRPYVLLGDVYLRTNDIDRLTSLLDQIQTRFEGRDEVNLLQTRKWIQEEKFGLISTINANTPQLRFYQAILAAMQNNHEQAKGIFVELFALPTRSDDEVLSLQAPDETEPTVSREFKRRTNDFMAIYDEFSSLKEGKNPHLFALYSKILSQHNEGLLAKKFADLAIQEEIGYIDAWVLRGYASFLMQEFEAALSDFQHAYELDPTRPESNYFLALTLYELEQYDEAGLYFERALDEEFEFSESVRWKLIDIFSKQKKYDKALELYSELLTPETEDSKFTSAIDMAVNLVGRSDLALEFTETLLEKDPNSNFAANLYAWSLIANKEYIKAEQILKDLLEEDDQIARTYLNFGLLKEKQNKFSEAKKYYKRAYEIGRAKEAPSSIINLSAESYNKLLKVSDRPEAEDDLSDRDASSP